MVSDRVTDRGQNGEAGAVGFHETDRRNPAPAAVCLIGIPSDENSSFLRGAAGGPAAVREALRCGASNLCAENGIDLGCSNHFSDAGNIGSPDNQPDFRKIRERVGEIIDEGKRVLSVGGDHAVTYPIIQAYGTRFENLRLIHMDAHPDLYESYDGNRGSHACVLSRILEENLVVRILQMGIRTWNEPQRRQAIRYGIPVRAPQPEPPDGIALEDETGPVYLSVDLDVLDPAFAPGVSHYEPGGVSTRALLQWIGSIRGPLVGADVVELNPDRDWNGMTAAVAAKLVKEIAGRMFQNDD
jgi:arginase